MFVVSIVKRVSCNLRSSRTSSVAGAVLSVLAPPVVLHPIHGKQNKTYCMQCDLLQIVLYPFAPEIANKSLLVGVSQGNSLKREFQKDCVQNPPWLPIPS